MMDENSRVSDLAGFETLELFAKADSYNRWLFNQLAPYCKGKILEIGSGVGNISSLFLENYPEVHLSDLDQAYCDVLRKKFNDFPAFREVHRVDLNNIPEYQMESLSGKFDTVVSSNVLEHIQNDALAIQNCHRFLKDGGNLVILVPAFMLLYNQFDRELGHHRRYTKKTLSRLIRNNGFDIVHSQYFNVSGILGWWLSGSVLQKKRLPSSQLKLYNRLVPALKLIDLICFRCFGLSVIVVGRKSSEVHENG